MKNLARDQRRLAEIFSVEGCGKRGGVLAGAGPLCAPSVILSALEALSKLHPNLVRCRTQGVNTPFSYCYELRAEAAVDMQCQRCRQEWSIFSEPMERKGLPHGGLYNPTLLTTYQHNIPTLGHNFEISVFSPFSSSLT